MSEGKYLFEQASSLTSLSHFCLGLRLYYIFALTAQTSGFIMFKSQLIATIKAFASSLKYFVFLILLPCFLGVVSCLND